MTDNEESRQDPGSEEPFFEPEPVEEGVTRPEVRQLRRTMEMLDKAERAYKIYPPNSTILNEFIDRSFGSIDEFLQENGNIQVTVLPSEFRYKGERVFAAEVKDTSLPFKLYESGIRFLAFFPGLERSELVAFLDVMKQMRHVDEDEDNVVTLLWEKEAPHITYLVMDRESEAGGVDIDQIPDPTVERNEMVKKIALRELSDRFDESEIDEELLPTLDDESQTRRIYGLTEEEKEGVHSLLEFEESYEPIYDFVELLFQIFRSEQDWETFSEMAGILEKILGVLASRGDYLKCSSILREMKRFLEETEDLSDAHREVFTKALAETGTTYRIEEAVERLEEATEEEVDHIFDFLNLMDPSALPHICNAITKEHEDRFMDLVVNLGKQNPEFIVGSLQSPHPPTVKAMLKILAEVGAGEALTEVSILLRHEDPSVRLEAANTLGSTGMPRAGMILVPSLDDEDTQVRKAALKHMVKLAGEKAFNPILAKIETKDFVNRPLSEKRDLLVAASRADPDRGVPVLKRILEKSSLFNREKNDETRRCAAMALGDLKIPAAVDVLRKFVNAKSKVVRDACAISLRKAEGKEVTRRLH